MMNTLSKFRKYGFMAIVCAATVLTACDDDDDDNPSPVTAPPHEHEHEVITDVTLIFTDTTTGGASVQARANDPDGEGAQPMQILDTIKLKVNTTYKLTYVIQNTEGSTPEDIGAEIATEADEHQLFYKFTNGIFTDPAGEGNMGGTSTINYLDFDSKNLPLGLETLWTTGNPTRGAAEFTTQLRHQDGGIKSATSDYTMGSADFNIKFPIVIE